jgi:hypothetical protein
MPKVWKSEFANQKVEISNDIQRAFDDENHIKINVAKIAKLLFNNRLIINANMRGDFSQYFDPDNHC